MHDLAFVVFEKEKKDKRQCLLAKLGLFKLRLGTALYYFIKNKEFKKGIIAFELEPGVEALSIKLPFSISMLTAFNRMYIESYISKIYTADGCKKCFAPAAVRKIGWFENYCMDTDYRTIVFKALLLPILDRIYQQNYFRLDNIETAVVDGGNPVDLLTAVKQLEPLLKYINVASIDKENVIKELEDVCSESGISIYASTDYKSILRNADLIINLGKLEDLSKCRIKSRSIVINLSGVGKSTLRGDFSVIMGVEYSFTENMYVRIGEEIINCFNKRELTDIIMAFKTGILTGGIYNDMTVTAILETFKNYGGKITRFIGRRGELRVEDVLKIEKANQ